jgi:hypothetical protein
MSLPEQPGLNCRLSYHINRYGASPQAAEFKQALHTYVAVTFMFAPGSTGLEIDLRRF